MNTLFFSEATKGCAGVKKNDGCKSSGNRFSNAKVCYCNDDMCNSDGFGNKKLILPKLLQKSFVLYDFNHDIIVYTLYIEDPVLQIPSSSALVSRSCCNGNFAEICRTIRIECRKFN